MGPLLGNSGVTVMNLILLASAVVPVTIVGILCWVFWRAAHRQDGAPDAGDGTPPKVESP